MEDMATRLFVLLLLPLVLVKADKTKKITVKPGEVATLPCEALDSKPALAVEWSRSDLDGEYVLLFRDKQMDPTYQHPTFRNRVNLKDGTMDLQLRNVTDADKGTYECRVFHRANRHKRAMLDGDPISTINLVVDPIPGILASHGNKMNSLPLWVFAVLMCYLWTF